MSREEIKAAVAPLLQQALAMDAATREATFAVLFSAIAAADGLPALREIIRRSLEAAERRIGTKVAAP